MSQLQVTGEAKIRDIQGPVVANSGVITALDGAASQYVRGDGTLADFPTSTGGGSSVSYYLNSSVSQGTIGGVAYRELSKEPVIGAGTDITISANGYVANYLTDANDPDVLSIPGGNFNCEFYFSVNNNSGNPTFYAELYKYDGTTFTLLGTSAGVPESINQGTTIAPYYFAIPVATAALALTDRLAIRIYVNVSGRTVTLHTENGHLCQVVTTLSKGMVSLNNLTDQSQFLTTGTSGTNFAIVSSGDTHTFNLPVASATNTGKLSSTDWSTFNGKVPYTGANASVNLGVYDLIASGIYGTFIEASVNGLASSPLVLRTGTTGFSSGTDAVSLISSPTSAHTLSIISNIASPNVTKRANIGLDLLSATRTFTFPDASGTLALTSNLSSYVPYTGATGAVNLGAYALTASALNVGDIVSDGNIILKKVGLSVSTPLYVTQFAATTGVGIGYSDGTGGGNFAFPTAAIYTYTFPASTGTLALTSDIPSLANYVTLNGTQTITGGKTFTSDLSVAKIAIANSNTLYTTTGYTTLSASNVGSTSWLGLVWGNGGGNAAVLAFNNSAQFTYTFPSVSGTMALLEETQTFSGSKTFTSLSTKVEALGIKLTTGVVSTGGYLTLNTKVVGTLHSLILAPDSATNRAEFTFDNTAIRTYALQNASGTIALLSGTQTFTGATTFSSNITVNSVQVGSAGNTTNIKLGDSAFGAITTGSNNIAIGTSALTSLTTSNANIGIGNSALASVVDGAFNTAIGFGIGASITSGSNNTLIGYGAGSSITTGNYNTILGNYAGTTAMSNNIVLADGQGNIRYQWNGTNNVFGNPISGTSATFSGNAAIGTTLSAWGSGYVGFQVGAAGSQMAVSNNNRIGLNFYFDGSAFKAIQTGAASLIEFDGDNFRFKNAPSVSANASQTFTERLTIASTGAATFSSSVGIGNTATTDRLSVTGTDYNNTAYLLGGATTGASYGLQIRAGSNSTDYALQISNRAGGEMFRVRGDGNVGIGTSSPDNKLGILGANNSTPQSDGISIYANNTTVFTKYGWGGLSAQFDYLFYTAGTERMRITSGGYTKASNNATYVSTTSDSHEFNNSAANWITENWNRNADPFGLRIKYPNATPNNTTNSFIYADDSSALRFQVRSNGGIANYATNNVVLSDERLKKDITPLESVWDKVKNIEIVKYKFNDQTHDDFNMGVIAQQVESIAPELVDIDGWGTLAEDGSTYKGVYESDINYYSIKALQEAMIKIELLEEKVKQLENK